MAKGYVQALLNALPSDLRAPLVAVFDYLQDSWRLGDGARATNAQWYKFVSTTASVAGTEFSIQHGLGQTPSKLIQVLDVTSTLAQFVTLRTTRAADAQRVYLSSTSSTSAVFTAYLEV